MKISSHKYLLTLLLSGILIGISGAKTDKQLGLHTGGGRWGFRPAKEYHDGLPRVLLIGDSVCSQYSALVIAKMKGIADVDVWVTGKHLNSGGLRDLLAQALDKGDYRVVHFNIGLHGWSEGRIPEGKYKPLLEAYVRVLKEKEPNAKLIWASTTSISEKKETPTVLDPIYNPVIVKRNALAAQVMKQYNIAINDLYTLSNQHMEFKGDRFHWKPEGRELMADAIVKQLKKALGE